jgi:hypothetical protein
MAPVKSWRPSVRGKKGVRHAVDVQSIRGGLSLLEARGAVIKKYYRASATAYVEIDGNTALALRDHPLIDFLEPDLTDFRLGSAGAPSLVRKSAAGGISNAKEYFRIPSFFAFSQSTPWGITAVSAPQAWSLTTGSGAKLLIIDTGHQQNHEDLASVSGSNCFGTYGGCSEGTYPHGTWVSGVLLARDNSVGVIGVAPGISSADVYYYGACPHSGGQCDTGEVIDAFDYAANNLGARSVINISPYSLSSNSGISSAVAAAWTAGNVIIASAGNSNVTGGDPVYPAAYSHVVGVSGINSDSTFAASSTTACTGAYSNYGNHVDLSGPFDAYTTEPTNSYGTQCGTSFATPHVAGTAVLIRALNSSFTNGEVVSQLIYTAKHLSGNPYDTHTGYGIVRADLAVGLYQVSMTASLVSGKPRLSWSAIPLASQYKIYRRIFRNGVGGEWEHWATTSSTSWTDIMSSSSFFGYNTWPASGTAVNYHVTAISSTGFESSWGGDATFIPIGQPPE